MSLNLGNTATECSLADPSQMWHTLMILLKPLKTFKHFGIMSFLELPSLRNTYEHAMVYNATTVLRRRLEEALKHDNFQLGY